MHGSLAVCPRPLRPVYDLPTPGSWLRLRRVNARRFCRFWWQLFFCSFWVATVAHAVVSEAPSADQTQWITADSGDATGKADFQRPFALETGLVKAILLAAAHQEATISLNGSIVGQVQGSQTATSLDVTRWIRSGTNLLSFQVVSTNGPAACRLMLELVLNDGRQSWVVSDVSWQARRAGQTTWATAVGRGAEGHQRWGNPFAGNRTADAYNSWALAQGATAATDPKTFSVAPGFRVDLLRSALPDEGSWIAMAFDPKGRLTVAKERRGLLRFTLGAQEVQRVESIEDTLMECRGLLYAYDSLYVNANNNKAMYRLRDGDGDGVFEDKKLMLATEGNLGHGRNQLRLGPDGLIYTLHGEDVVLPKNLAPESPIQQLVNDQLMPTLDPRVPPRFTRYLQVGHVLQTDKEGSFFRLHAGGLRNAMALAFNEEGEMFTWDADMELDIGTPWYRPTRVLHVVPGGDYGWRRGTGNLPPYAPDTLPSVLDTGVGSPTGIAFAQGNQFPDPYRRALFMGDWAYGRILAVQMLPQGATYQGSPVEFLSGRPLNITDLTFGPDGSLYFVTGGRGTKSGLYRVAWNGKSSGGSVASADAATATARSLRRSLEKPQPTTPEGLNAVWTQLGHSDRWIRNAARRALERFPIQDWGNRALQETNNAVALESLLALVRMAGPDSRPMLIARLETFPYKSLSEPQQLAALRILTISLARHGTPTNVSLATLQDQLLSIYPSNSELVNRELCRVLTHLRTPAAFGKSLALLAKASTADDRLFYLMTLWALRDGWNLDQLKTYFTGLRQANQEQGARDYFATVKFLYGSMTNRLASAERLGLGDLFTLQTQQTRVAIAPTTPSSKSWTLQDFDFSKPRAQSSLTAGREAFLSSGCVLCHRAGSEGGLIGPDLNGVSSRFGRQDLLDHILNPSKAVDEKYRLVTLTLKDGTSLSGSLNRDDEVVVIQPTLPGSAPVELSKAQIQDRQSSEQSPMPSGLLDGLGREQIYDLVDYLQSLQATKP